MARAFDFLHIKRRTAGSSNELSFDVLDAASSRLDAGQKAKKGKKGRGAVAAPSHAKASYDSALAAEDEVKRRKRDRRLRSMRLKVLVCLMIMVIMCAGAFLGYRLYQQRTDFNGRVNGLVSRIVEADGSLVGIDALMKDPFSPLQAEQRQQAMDQAAAINAQLESVIAENSQLASQVENEGDATTLREIEAAAQARRAMLGAAASAFRLADDIGALEDQANAIWIQVVDADQQVRDAAELANGATTEEATIQARDRTQEAIGALQQADTDLAVLEQQVEGLDLGAQQAYLEKRIEALGYAVATSEALLRNDRAGATEANEAYNRLEQEAAAMAAELPASVGDVVRGAFTAKMEAAQADYGTTRALVTKADANLRSRLP